MAARKNKAASLSLHGDQTIQNITNAHKTLCAEFQDRSEIVLDVSKIEDVDLNFVQLIESARHTAKQQGKSFALSAGASGALLDVLQRGGFVANPDASTFWLHKSGAR